MSLVIILSSVALVTSVAALVMHASSKKHKAAAKRTLEQMGNLQENHDEEVNRLKSQFNKVQREVTLLKGQQGSPVRYVGVKARIEAAIKCNQLFMTTHKIQDRIEILNIREALLSGIENLENIHVVPLTRSQVNKRLGSHACYPKHITCLIEDLIDHEPEVVTGKVDEVSDENTCSASATPLIFTGATSDKSSSHHLSKSDTCTSSSSSSDNSSSPSSDSGC